MNDNDAYSPLESHTRCWDERTRTLLGNEAIAKLEKSRVLIVGVGGVGGYAAEVIARSGVGSITLIDADCVDITNLNRQLIATLGGVGQSKVILFAERFHDINPHADIKALRMYVDGDNIDSILEEQYDFVVDAIDSVAPKIELLSRCLTRGIPVISSMGAGGRIDPSKVGYHDVWETRNDGLARAVRQRLKKLGIRKKLPVVASSEMPRKYSLVEVGERNKLTSYGTTAAVPATFGLFMGAYVVNRLSGIKEK